MLMTLFIQALTLSRALMALLISRLILTRQDKWALCIVILAFATDIADGWAARRFKKESTLGKVLDPVVDKIFVLCTVHALFVRFQIGMGLFYALCIRDSLLGLGALVLWKKRGCILSPSWMGKMAMGLQMTSIALVMAQPLWPGPAHVLQEIEKGVGLLFSSALLASLTSFYYYALDFIRIVWIKQSQWPPKILRFCTLARFVMVPLAFVVHDPRHDHLWAGLSLFTLALNVHRFQKTSSTDTALNLTADQMCFFSFFLKCLLSKPLYKMPTSPTTYALEELEWFFTWLMVAIYLTRGVCCWKMWKMKCAFPVSRLGQISLWMLAVFMLNTCLEQWHLHLYPLHPEIPPVFSFLTSFFSAIPLFIKYIRSYDAIEKTAHKK